MAEGVGPANVREAIGGFRSPLLPASVGGRPSSFSDQQPHCLLPPRPGHPRAAESVLS